jgi:hypothetical protein
MNVGFRVPTAAQYADALRKIKINPMQRKMLEAHYRAHNRTLTYTDLAKDGGSEDFRAANAHYGALGHALGDELGITFYPSIDREEPFYSSAIGMGNAYKAESEEFVLVMHHELAKALEQLGWFHS